MSVIGSRMRYTTARSLKSSDHIFCLFVFFISRGCGLDSSTSDVPMS